MIENGGARVGGKRWWQTALVVAWVCYSVAHLGYSIWRYNVFVNRPSGIFAEAMNYGHPNGGLDVALLRSFGEGNPLYPPLFVILFLPLARLGVTPVTCVYYFLQFPLFAWALYLLVKAADGAPASTGLRCLIAGTLAVNFQPFLETIAEHKIEGIEFVLICTAIYLFKKRRDLWTGIVVTIAANLKYLPGMLAVYFLCKRQWRVMLGVLGALVIYVAGVLAVLGPEITWFYAIEHPFQLLTLHRHQGTGIDGSIQRQTLGGTVYKWFSRVQGSNTFEQQLRIGTFAVSQPRLAHVLAQGLKVLTFGWYVWFISRRRWRPADRQVRWPLILYEYSLTLIMIFIVAQAALVHYAILVLPAFVLTGLLLYQHRARFHWPEKVLFFAAYSLSGWLIPGGLLDHLPPAPLWGQAHANFYLWLSLPFYGFVLLGVCIVLCYRRVLQTSHSSPVKA